MPSENYAASPDDEDQGCAGHEQTHAVASFDGGGREDERERAVRRGRAERVAAREGVGRQLDERILELRASPLEERFERLAEEEAACEGCHHEDRRRRPAAPGEKQPREQRQRAKDDSAPRVRDDLHRVDQVLRSRSPHPAHGADVEAVCARPEEHRGRDGHEGGAGNGEHRGVQACQVPVHHHRTIPAKALPDA